MACALTEQTTITNKKKVFDSEEISASLQEVMSSTHTVTILISNAPSLKRNSSPLIKCQLQECVNKTKQPTPKPTHTPKALFTLYIYITCLHR